MRLFAFLSLLCPLSLSAATVPNTTTNWTFAGVPGGIPNRTTIYTNLTGIDNTGATDVSAAINGALASCPSGQVVYLPAGHFKLVTNRLSVPAGVVFRGAGPTNTILENNLSSFAMIFGPSDWPVPTLSISISGGATVGSSNVTVSSTSGIATNLMIRIGENDPDYVWNNNGQTNTLCSMHLVTAISGSNVTFWPPLVLSLTNSPQIATYTYTTKDVGIESMKINCTNAAAGGIEAYQTWGCWITNVEVAGSPNRQFLLDVFNAGSVVGCYTHDPSSAGPGHEGIDFFSYGCWNLIENNMSHRGGMPAIMLGDSRGGCVGNVIAYNFIDDTDSGSSVAGDSIGVNHGPFNMFNLVEGNVCQMIQSDGYFGGAGFNTLFRNYCSGVYTNSYQWPRCIDITHYSYWFTVAGNVLGTNDRTFNYTTEENAYGWPTPPLIYRFGYPYMGNMGYSGTNPPSTTGTELDLNVKSNTFLICNFDYATTNVVNWTNGLPASLYLASAPSWWGTNRWPPIDPLSAPMVGTIPAQLRYLGIPNGTNTPPIPPIPSTPGAPPWGLMMMQFSRTNSPGALIAVYFSDLSKQQKALVQWRPTLVASNVTNGFWSIQAQ